MIKRPKGSKKRRRLGPLGRALLAGFNGRQTPEQLRMVTEALHKALSR